MVLIQCFILIFQIYQLTRYDEDIKEHMPTISREGNEEITEPYYLSTAEIPSLSQLILLPVIWVMLLYRAKYTLNGAYILLFSCWLTSFSWFASFIAIVYAIAAFD